MVYTLGALATKIEFHDMKEHDNLSQPCLLARQKKKNSFVSDHNKHSLLIMEASLLSNTSTTIYCCHECIQVSYVFAHMYTPL